MIRVCPRHDGFRQQRILDFLIFTPKAQLSEASGRNIELESQLDSTEQLLKESSARADSVTEVCMYIGL